MLDDIFPKNPTLLREKIVNVKVCGITNEADIRACIELGVDAVGFIIGKQKLSPFGDPLNDKISLTKAINLVSYTRNYISSVVLIHSTSLEEILFLCRKVNPQVLQIQSEISLHDLERLRFKISNIKIIKSVHIWPDDSPTHILKRSIELASSGVVDCILIDTRIDNRTGGTGMTHDWKISKGVVEALPEFPLILAGGLNPENVAQAVSAVEPYAVDVLTGVKKSEGIKDHHKIRALIEKLLKPLP